MALSQNITLIPQNITLKTLDNLIYCLPAEFLQNLGGYFALISSKYSNFDEIKKVQLNSHQINFLLFNLDKYEFQEFIPLIPTFLQFSIKEFDMKVMTKIERWVKQNKKFDGKEINADDQKLLTSIASNISDTSTIEDLEKVIFQSFATDLSLSRETILDTIETLNFEQTKNYIMTLTNLDEEIFDVMRYDIDDYLECDDFDDFVLYLIDNFVDIENKDYPILIEAIFKSASPLVIRYLSGKEIKNFDTVYTSAISNLYFRKLEEIIIEFIDKLPVLNVCQRYDIYEGTGLDCICNYGSPRLLKKALQKIPLAILKQKRPCKKFASWCYKSPTDTLKLIFLNENEEMKSFLKDNDEKLRSIENLGQLKKVMNW